MLVMQRDLGTCLLDDLIDKDPAEKLERIYHSLIKNFGDTLTDDLPMATENESDKKKFNQ